MKKIISSIMAIVMMIALSTAAYADDTKYSCGGCDRRDSCEKKREIENKAQSFVFFVFSLWISSIVYLIV